MEPVEVTENGWYMSRFVATMYKANNIISQVSQETKVLFSRRKVTNRKIAI